MSATIIYDKSVFDTSSIGDEGRYKFELKQDSAADEEAGGESESSNNSEEDAVEEDSSMIKIEDVPDGDSSSQSEDKDDDSLMPSLDGPSS